MESGCTSHMCKDQDMFVNLNECESGNLNVSQQSIDKKKKKKSCKVNKEIILNDILHVLELPTNLLSVSITDKHCKVILEKDEDVSISLFHPRDIVLKLL